MKRKYKIALACVIVVLLSIVGLKIYLFLTPVVEFGTDRPTGLIFDPSTKASKVFNSVSECAQRQKGLFGYIEAFREKHGKVPESITELINDDMRSMYFTRCPLEVSYIIHPENYGNSNAVFISEAQNKHPNTLSLRIRGIKPCVQTMGDGTIYLFEDGKIATVNAKKD